MDKLKRVSASATGISYQGVSACWDTGYGKMIFIAENPEALSLFCLDVFGEEADESIFVQAAVFSQKDVKEVA
jgi:hypothetical protein